MQLKKKKQLIDKWSSRVDFTSRKSKKKNVCSVLTYFSLLKVRNSCQLVNVIRIVNRIASLEVSPELWNTQTTASMRLWERSKTRHHLCKIELHF